MIQKPQLPVEAKPPSIRGLEVMGCSLRTTFRQRKSSFRVGASPLEHPLNRPFRQPPNTMAEISTLPRRAPPPALRRSPARLWCRPSAPVLAPTPVRAQSALSCNAPRCTATVFGWSRATSRVSRVASARSGWWDGEFGCPRTCRRPREQSSNYVQSGRPFSYSKSAISGVV